MTTLQRSEALRLARRVIAHAELGALSGAIDRAWAKLSDDARDSLRAYRDAARPTSRDFAGHHLFAEVVAQELLQAQRPGVRVEPVQECEP